MKESKARSDNPNSTLGNPKNQNLEMTNQENGKLTRRQFFKTAGIAALIAATLKFLPNTLLSEKVLAWPECANCPNDECGCFCGFYETTYCDVLCPISCYGGRPMDLIDVYEIWQNEPFQQCCVSYCYPGFNIQECESPHCGECWG